MDFKNLYKRDREIDRMALEAETIHDELDTVIKVLLKRQIKQRSKVLAKLTEFQAALNEAHIEYLKIEAAGDDIQLHILDEEFIINDFIKTEWGSPGRMDPGKLREAAAEIIKWGDVKPNPLKNYLEGMLEKVQEDIKEWTEETEKLTKLL